MKPIVSITQQSAPTPAEAATLPLPAAECRGEIDGSAQAMHWRATIGWGVLAVVSFHLAFHSPALAFLVAVYLFSLFRLSGVATPRQALWAGIAVGLLCFGPQLSFFYTIFGPSAVALWTVLAFWVGLFVLSQHLVRLRLGARAAAWLAPFLWTGFEFFRSELYHLRFTWLSAGYSFAEGPNLALIYWPGVYGVGFILMAAVAWGSLLPRNLKLAAAGAAALLGVLLCNARLSTPAAPLSEARPLRIAGIQIEHKHDLEVLNALKILRHGQPGAEVLVLSELAFDGPVPERVRKWCATEGIHLVAGGKDPVSADGKAFYNSVFVIGTDGALLHKQAKTRPIQFMADGLPALGQKLWNSPWGRIGFCICYDKSFTRVTDELVRLGAQALIVPTADEIEWGRHQHRLHARIAPVRAAEYRLPIFRQASSGISQVIERDGTVTASAPFPGELATMSGTLQLGVPGRIPPDRLLSLLCSAAAWGLLGWAILVPLLQRRLPSRHSRP